MEVIKLVFTQLAPMHEQNITPYSFDLRAHNIEEFAKATNDGQNISAFRLAKAASGLLVPNLARERRLKAHAPNGWDQDRLAFAMVVAINNRERSKTYQYIVGTCDYDGSGGTDSKVTFDPKMKLYFNSITKIHFNESIHRDRRVWVPKIQAHDQILNRDSLEGYGGGRDSLRERPVTLRPTDVFRRRTGATQFAKHFTNDSNVNNLCGAFTTQLKSSNRDNNSTSLYLSRTLSAYMASAADPDLAYHNDTGNYDTLNHAHDRVEENDLELDPYIEQMKEQYRILDDGYIRFSELMRMNPDFDFDKIIFGRRKRGSNISLSNQAGWNGTDNETMAARIIARSLPNFMIMAGYSEVEDLVLDTTARSGHEQVHVSKPWPFIDGMSVRANWPYFEGACRDILIHEATCGGRYQMQARINANIDRLIKIHIRIDGDDEAYFEFPACMDASLAPTLETDNKAFDALAKGVVGLASELSGRRLNEAPNHSDTPAISLSSRVEEARRERDERNERKDDREPSRSSRSTKSERDW